MPLREITATLLFVTAIASTSISQARPAATITVGSLSLTLCNTGYAGYCGSIRRPLDPSGAVKGSIDIGFEFYPRRNTALPRLGTLLPQEGGGTWLLVHRFAGLLSRPVRCAARPARRPHHRQAGHRPVGRHRLSGHAIGIGFPCRGWRLREPARRKLLVVRYPIRSGRHRCRARCTGPARGGLLW